MSTLIIAQPAYVASAVNELLVNFPQWCNEFEHRVRIERAENIANAGGIESPGENRYLVPSNRGDGEPYTVERSVGTCTCPDYRKHLFDTSRTGWKCKHRIAVYLTVRAVEMEAEDHATQAAKAEQAERDAQELIAQAEAIARQTNRANGNDNGHGDSFDAYVQTLDQPPADEPAPKPRRKPTSRKAKTQATEKAPDCEVGGTWDVLFGEIVHVCADGFQGAALMGFGSELWCYRCNQTMPQMAHVTREQRAAYVYGGNDDA